MKLSFDREDLGAALDTIAFENKKTEK